MRAANGIGHARGQLALAEGLETEAQEALLPSLGCDPVRGCIFARSVSAEMLLPYLAAHA